MDKIKRPRHKVEITIKGPRTVLFFQMCIINNTYKKEESVRCLLNREITKKIPSVKRFRFVFIRLQEDSVSFYFIWDFQAL